jgi:hypothetical protein
LKDPRKPFVAPPSAGHCVKNADHFRIVALADLGTRENALHFATEKYDTRDIGEIFGHDQDMVFCGVCLAYKYKYTHKDSGTERDTLFYPLPT